LVLNTKKPIRSSKDFIDNLAVGDTQAEFPDVSGVPAATYYGLWNSGTPIMIGKKGDKMNRIARVSFFGIALAVVLALGIPGKANALVNDNGPNGRLILAGDLGITIGEGGIGIDINKDRAERDREYDRERAYDRDRTYDQDRARDREYDQRRDYNRENAESRTYDPE
jgi:hypothetical protein